MTQYLSNANQVKRRNENIHEISEIIKFFQTKKSKIIKYNHCIDVSSSKINQYDGFLQLTLDDEV